MTVAIVENRWKPTDADAIAHFHRMTSGRPYIRYHLHALIAGLKADGIWSNLQQLCVHQGSKADSLLDLTGNADATDPGSATWTAANGFQLGATPGKYIDTGLLYGAGEVMTFNDQHISVYCNDKYPSVRSTGEVAGAKSGSNNVDLLCIDNQATTGHPDVVSGGNFPSSASFNTNWNGSIQYGSASGSSAVTWNASADVQFYIDTNFGSASTCWAEMSQACTTVIGEWYTLQMDKNTTGTENALTVDLKAGTTNYGSELGSSSDTSNDVTQYVRFQATSTTTYVTVRVSKLLTTVNDYTHINLMSLKLSHSEARSRVFSAGAGSYKTLTAGGDTSVTDTGYSGFLALSQSATVQRVRSQITNANQSSTPNAEDLGTNSLIIGGAYPSGVKAGVCDADYFAWSAGTSMSAAELQNLQTRIETYLAAMGVP